MNEFKISFTIDLNPYIAGLKTMLNMTGEAGKQIMPLLNMQVKAPDFSPFEKQIVAYEKELDQLKQSQQGAAGTAGQMTEAERLAAEAAKRLADEQKKTKPATDAMSDSFQKAFFAISTVQQVGNILRSTFGGLIADSNEAERRQMSLTAALDAAGGATDEDRIAMKKYSEEMSKLTGVDDDAITGAQAMLVAFTGLKGAGLNPAMDAVMDLSSALEMDLNTSAQMMGRIVEFGSGKLGKFKIDVSDVKDESARWDKVIQAVNEHFSGFAEKMGTTGEGQMKKFGVTVGSVKEKLGDLIKSGMMPFLNAATPLLEWFTKAPGPLQTVIGMVAMATVGLIALRMTGLMPLITNMNLFAVNLLTQMVPALGATTVAIHGTTVALTTMQMAAGGFLLLAGTIAAFIGLNAWLKNNEAQMLANARATKAAQDSLEAYKESVKDIPTITVEEYGLKTFEEIQKRRKEIREKYETENPESPQSKVNPLIDRAQREREIERKMNEDAYLKALEQEYKNTADIIRAREEEQRQLEAKLKNANALVKAQLELNEAKKKLDKPGLDESQIKQINLEIYAKEQEVKRLEELGVKELQDSQKKMEEEKKLKQEHNKTMIDYDSQLETIVLKTQEETEMAAEKSEIGKLAVAEKFAIARIDLEEKKQLKLLELQKVGASPEEMKRIDELIEKVKSIKVEERKGVRTETNIKVGDIETKTAPIGSVLAQQEKVKKAEEAFYRATTDAARKSAKEKMDAEQDLLDKMTMTSAQMLQRDRKLNEARRQEWMETHQLQVGLIRSLSAGMQTMWNQMIIGNRQAADEADAVWLAIRNTALQALGDIIVKAIENAIISEVMGAAATAITVGEMATIAAAAAPAATLVSIATFGSAAAAGTAAVIGGLATVQALVAIPRLEEGGRIKEGAVGFFEGKAAELVAPEETFLQVLRGEMLPKILMEQDRLNQQRFNERLSEKIIVLREKSSGSQMDSEMLRKIHSELHELRELTRKKDWSPTIPISIDGVMTADSYKRAKRKAEAQKK